MKRASYLNIEINQSQELVWRAMKKQTPANNHTAKTIKIVILEMVWSPLCIKTPLSTTMARPHEFKDVIQFEFTQHMR